MTASLTEIYERLAAAGQIRPDPAQREALPELERLRRELEAAPPPAKGLLARFRKAPPLPKGLYLWGGVGRGKSMLMDLFIENVAIEKKRRVHFHAFMQEIQAGLDVARRAGAQDAVRPVAQKVAEEARLLCFDEMQITDIADAMIVGRLFDCLEEFGTVVVTTSNRVPEDLYKNGLNRQLFLPFIERIRARMVVHELASETDYRQNRLSDRQVYFTPADARADRAIEEIWTELTGRQAAGPLRLKVKGREVELPQFHAGAGRCSFWDLCAKPLGPADYLAVAEACRVLILEHIPHLSSSNFNEAKRFVTLIDALYEAKVKLIASAAEEPERLYREGEGSFEFERSASRLREMQAQDWGQDGGQD